VGSYTYKNKKHRGTNKARRVYLFGLCWFWGLKIGDTPSKLACYSVPRQPRMQETNASKEKKRCVISAYHKQKDISISLGVGGGGFCIGQIVDGGVQRRGVSF
jgi:hypothetical protein